MDRGIEQLSHLLQRQKITSYEIFGQSVDSIRAEARDGKTNSLVRAKETGFALRVLVKGCMGFSFGAEPSLPLIEAAVSSAHHQFSDQRLGLPPAEPPCSAPGIYDPVTAALTADDCIEQALLLEQAARGSDERVTQVRKATFSRSLNAVRIASSTGICASGSATHATAAIMVMAQQGDDQQAGFEADRGHFLSEIDVASVGRRAAAKACGMLGARTVPSMDVAVLFDPTCSAELLGFLAGSFSGERVIKDTSFLKDKLGRPCFASVMSLYDDPLHPRAAGAFGFDGEGVPSRRTTLVEGGVLKAFVYDTYWGAVAGGSSTGNAVRSSWRARPSCGIRHLHLMPQGGSLDGILPTLKQTLKITDIMGMHTGDPISGDLSVGVAGHLMERGQILYPVRSAALSGNIFEMLTRVVACGDDARPCS